ncbi:MAG: glycosyltransferase family 2 protein [Treponemataceae bacterium]|nr:glycosyltransferase family 2 protein [Treponemataceae bacterium]
MPTIVQEGTAAKGNIYSQADVTVIIPAFNSEKTIVRALDSVYKQNKRPAKILIINDGSKDNTEIVCREWISNNPDIACDFITTENKGVSSARNEGLKLAKTSLAAFLDSDDTWTPDKIEKQLEVFNSNSFSLCNLVCTGSILRSVSGKTYQLSKRKLLFSNLVVTSSVLVKTDVIKKYFFDSRLKRSEDFNLLLKIAARDKGIIIVDSILTNYTIDSTQNKLSNDKKNFQKDEIRNFCFLLNEHYISLGEFLLASIFSYIKYIRRGIIKHENC